MTSFCNVLLSIALLCCFLLFIVMFVFHSVAFLVNYLKIKQENEDSEKEDAGKPRRIRSRLKLADSEFIPVHTINAVRKVLIQEKWRGEVSSIVVFGCGHLERFRDLYHIIGVTNIMLVDVDEECLDDVKSMLTKSKELHDKHEMLSTCLFVGSIGDPDTRTQGAGAVLAIDLIHHLYPDTLEGLPYNIFGFIKPKLAIITTINADFNVVFEGLVGFRSENHKFEWTREQFQSWAENICMQFTEYSVYFKGIGQGLAGTEQYGCCYQMAVFERMDFARKNRINEVPFECRVCKDRIVNFVTLSSVDAYSHGICTYCSYTKQIERWEQRRIIQPGSNSSLSTSTNDDFQIWSYKMIMWMEYNKNMSSNWSIEKQLIHEVEKAILNLNQSEILDDDSYQGYVKVPLYKLVINEHGLFTTISELRKVLPDAGYVIERRLYAESGKHHWSIIRPRIMRKPSDSAAESSNEDTDDDNWKTESSSEQSSPSNSRNATTNEEHNEQRQENKDAVDCVMNDILIGLENHQEGNLSLNQNNGSVKENNSLTVVQSSKKPLEGNYDKFVVFGAACTSSRNKASKSTDDVKQTPKEKISRHRNYDENEADILGRFTSTETNNRLKTMEHKFNKTNIKDALLKMASTMESGNQNQNQKNHQSKKDSLAETSKFKKKAKAKKAETEEDILKEDMKNLTTCIVYNSLNKVEQQQVASSSSSGVGNAPISEFPVIIPTHPLEIDTPGPALPEIIPIIESQDGNLDDKPASSSSSHASSGYCGGSGGVKDEVAVDGNVVGSNSGVEERQETEAERLSLNFASREALFDPNSEIDMLEEVDNPPRSEEPSILPSSIPPSNDDIQNHFMNQNVVVIGVRMNQESAESVAMPQNPDPFPNWLLQLLGANVLEEGESHNEPHFYCQGDGIGVHPSIVEVDIEEELSSSESTSSNDDAAEHTISENDINDFFEDIPFEDVVAAANNQEELDNILPPLPVKIVNGALITTTTPAGNSNNAFSEESSEEFFDTIDHPKSSTSDSQEQNQQIDETVIPTTSRKKSDTSTSKSESKMSHKSSSNNKL